MAHTSPRPPDTGLCVSCQHAPHCSLPSDTSQPIWFCGEFDVSGSATIAHDDSALAASRAALAAAAEREPAPQLRGLCSNCDERSICALAPPAGGVWHCGEYR